MSPDDPRHGTIPGRAAHRRDGEDPCQPCKDANALYQRRYRKTRALYGDRTVPVLGVTRRVQALMCLGWSMTQIAARVGMDQKQLWLTTQQTVVRRTTAARIASVYDELCMRRPPTDTKSQRISVAKTLGHAGRSGFYPPLAWDNIDDPNEVPSGAKVRPVTTIRERTFSSPDHRACPRCGVVREVYQDGIRGDLCRDCLEAEPSEAGAA